jgi:hypothetical protein
MALSESPGTVAVPMSEIGRFATFTVSLAGTRQPPGSRLSVMASASVTENLNALIRNLHEDSHWIWILGDDHVWENDCLLRLLAAMDDTPEADILVPLVVKRNPPWHLVIFHENGIREEDGMPRWRPYEWNEVPEEGTFEIDAAGSAGMLIKREVLDEMGDPWFKSTGGVVLNEDVTFCRDSRALGFRIYACADVTMGHIGIFNVRPMRRNGRWGAMTEFASPDERFQNVFMPDIEDKHPEVVAAHG